MYFRDTIAALATAVGQAAIAVVRISGDDAEAVARRVFRGRSPDRWETHRLVLGRVVDAEERTLDQCLAVIMRAPTSYSGEDVVELHCHGGATVARSVLAAVLRAGARPAERGEFTSRAVLNGKLDLAQAEAVADLIAARTERAVRAAAAQLEGALSRAVATLRHRLVGVAAMLEVAIDFAEEDVGVLDRDALLGTTSGIAAELRALAATYGHGRLLREGIRVALVGRPNSGKSSLLNRLIGSDRAIVTAVAGTTRDVIEESLDIDGMAITLSDTAGLRASADVVEQIGIAKTYEEIREADLVIGVFDGSALWSDEDNTVIAALRHKKSISLINKVDLPGKLNFPAVDSGSRQLLVSAKTGEGMHAIRRAIVEIVGLDSDDTGGVTVTRERHLAAIESAAAAADRAVEAIGSAIPPDVVGVDIMIALDHLGEIVGATSTEDVLDRVFREFCIGK